MNPEPANQVFEEIDLKEIIGVIFKWKWLIIGLTFIAVVSSSIFSYFILSPVYETRAVLMVPYSTEQQRSSLREDESLEGLARNLSTLPKMNLNTYVQQFKSDRLVENVIKSLKLDEEGYTVNSLSESVSASIINETNLIEVKVTNADPDMAALIVNSLSEEYIKFISTLNKERIDQSIEIFQDQISSIERDLTEANKMLSNYNNQVRNIAFIEAELESMLAALQSGRSGVTQNDVDILQAELTEEKVEHNRLLREVDRLERNYNLFADSLIETQIFGSVDIGKSNIQIVATATPPTSPIKPNKKLNMAIAFVLALMVGVFTAFVLEFFDNNIKNGEDVKKHLDLPIMGYIPKINGRDTKTSVSLPADKE